ncbi:hypothetical protein LCGC14_1551990 [marine sediment metagenome]|uniref:Uncharacterized protein n=1 Tax=marine sediment metagenome TaxID=412755 RepID=A0A0F9JB09_9ZZZZ
MVENIEENTGEMIEEISVLPARSGNKTVYLVVVEEPFSKRKKQQFVTRFLEQKPLGIELIGYEISNTAKIKSHRDAVDEANKGSKELYNIILPWHRVISIRNVTYTLPQ